MYHIVHRRVVGDDGLYLGVAETLVGKLLLEQLLVLVDDVVRELGVTLELELLRQVLLL